VNEIIQVLGMTIVLIVIVLIVYVMFKKRQAKEYKHLTNRQLPTEVKKLKYDVCRNCGGNRVVIIGTDGFDKDIVECIKCKEVFNWYGVYAKKKG